MDEVVRERKESPSNVMGPTKRVVWWALMTYDWLS